MYINFWYPIALSEEVTRDKPFGVQILGLPFVAFRDSDGTPHVLSNTCIHRGGALARGWVRDGCVICPYHGWEFGGDGHCTRIPTLPDGQKLPARAKVDSYPTQERYGILFAFLGDLPEAERPTLYDIVEFDADGWRANEIVRFEVDAYYERSVENGLDAAHNEFVHPMQGGPSIARTLQEHPMEVVEMPPWGSEFLMQYGGYANREGQTLAAGEGSTRAGSGHHGPNTLITRIMFNDQNQFLQVFFEAPINDRRTRIFFVNLRSFMLDPDQDQRLIDINMGIAGEDMGIIEHLDPVRTPDSTTKELLLPQDKPILRYREMLKDWESRGWRIDPAAFKAQQGDVAMAIPSPARRDSKNWILDTVPLVPPAAAARSAAGGSG